MGAIATIVTLFWTIIFVFVFSFPFWFIGKLASKDGSYGYVRTCFLGFKTLIHKSMEFKKFYDDVNKMNKK